jgi:predicted PurR-regulated permease PerM
VILLAVGAVVSVVDNFIRPLLSRYGELELPTFLLLIAMLGGVAAFGAFGLLLGPLMVRLSLEGWEILHDEGLEPS